MKADKGAFLPEGEGNREAVEGWFGIEPECSGAEWLKPPLHHTLRARSPSPSGRIYQFRRMVGPIRAMSSTQIVPLKCAGIDLTWSAV
jgi:hypothetical protein